MNRIETKSVGGILCLAVVKRKERYVIMFREATRREALRALGRYAADERLAFNWHDAAAASKVLETLS